jgi:hypothetical protein
MPETKTIPTTVRRTFTDGELKLTTEYDPMIPVLSAFISPVDQEVDGVLFRMGDLGISIEDRFYPDDIDVSLSDSGELIISGNLAASFSLNANGELIYTY